MSKDKKDDSSKDKDKTNQGHYSYDKIRKDKQGHRKPPGSLKDKEK